MAGKLSLSVCAHCQASSSPELSLGCLQGGVVMRAFSIFVDCYHVEKTAALDQILDHADEAFKVVTPDVWAPAIYVRPACLLLRLVSFEPVHFDCHSKPSTCSCTYQTLQPSSGSGSRWINSSERSSFLSGRSTLHGSSISALALARQLLWPHPLSSLGALTFKCLPAARHAG